jgi:hypothetical protein
MDIEQNGVSYNKVCFIVSEQNTCVCRNSRLKVSNIVSVNSIEFIASKNMVNSECE